MKTNILKIIYVIFPKYEKSTYSLLEAWNNNDKKYRDNTTKYNNILVSPFRNN